MKLLLAVMSCWLCELNGDNQSVRDTWKKDVPVDVTCAFFHGTGCSRFPGSDRKVSIEDIPEVPLDIVILRSPEAYEHLIERAQELYQLAYDENYDFVFKGYSDTYVDVPALLSSGFEKHDHFGHIHTADGTARGDGTFFKHGFLGGGEGYWLSRRACEIIANATPNPEPVGEDLWVGEVLGAAGVPMVDHRGYGSGVTLHGSILQKPIDYRPGVYTNNWMYETYKRLKG
jgi:hypothetical protein